MTKRRKLYKYTLVPLFSLLLSLCLLGKSAEAATATIGFGSGSSGVGSFWVGVEGFESFPESIELYDQANPATDNSSYTVPGGLNLYLRFSQDCGANSNYHGGYLNGSFTFNLIMDITNSETVTAAQSQPILLYNGVQTETFSSALVYRSGNSYQFCCTFANYSLPPVGGSNRREVYLGNLDIKYQFKRAADGVQPKITALTNFTGIATSVYCTAIAEPGVSLAGQVYSAIENSTQVSEIVGYLSMINDSCGDINIAVSHINETLLPNVITYLQSLIANTNLTNTKLNTLVNYLNVISSTWPNYSSQVLFYLSQLVNMNEEQSSLAAEVESQYEAKASEGAQLNQGMQVVIPSVDQNSFDINSNIDTGTITTLTAFWSMFTHNTLISIMFMIAIAGIAAGFFLYGKKG